MECAKQNKTFISENHRHYTRTYNVFA